MTQRGLAHLLHHDVHWEYCEDFEGRVRFIIEEKPAKEISERLKWFQILPDERLFPKLLKAIAALNKASADCDSAYADWNNANKASADWDKALADWGNAYTDWGNAIADWGEAIAALEPELKILHAELFPGCPWNEKQHTMFPEKEIQ